LFGTLKQAGRISGARVSRAGLPRQSERTDPQQV